MEHLIEQLTLAQKLAAYENLPFIAYLAEMALTEAAAEKERRKLAPAVHGHTSIQGSRREPYKAEGPISSRASKALALRS